MGVESDTVLLPAFQNWHKSQPHLPQNIEPLLLKRYLQASRGDLEKAKQYLELSFVIRNNNPHIFLERDPCDKASQAILGITDMLPLPLTTKENYKVLFYRLVDVDADKYNFTECIKMFFMVADVRLITPDSNGLTEGEIPIFDMTGFSLRHITKTVLSVLRVYMKFTQEAHPVRLKQIHIINCSSFLDRVLTLIKPFAKSEVFKLIHFHLPGSDTLYKFVPKELLPTEYGGKAGDIQDIKNDMIKKLETHRQYLMDPTRWKINSIKKGQSNEKNQLNGNFRSLTID